VLLGVVLTRVNDTTFFMKKLKSKKELSRDFPHHGEGNSSLRKETTVLGHVGTHGLNHKADVVSVGPTMLKLGQET
jgi:hypothetical protein